MPWYLFTPPGTGTEDPSDPNQYTLQPLGAPTCAFPKQEVCAIQAADNLGKPVLSTNIPLLREIIRAQHNQTESTNVLLRPA